MNGDKMLKQMQAILRLLMAFFYLGAGIFLLFFADNFKIDKALRNIVGGTFLFYGIYRLYMASVSVFRLFFSSENNNKD